MTGREPSQRETAASASDNLGRMSDEKLRKEWYLVTGFKERPPIREAYIDAMIEEFCRRGLSQPMDVRYA